MEDVYDTLSDLECEMETLGPLERDMFVLRHHKLIVRLHEERDLLYGEGECELLDEGKVDCCSLPCLVVDENVHDEICVNCGSANHLATLTVGRVQHVESLKDGQLSSRVYYKRITHFKRYLRDIQAAHIHLPQELIEDMKIHVAFPSESSVRSYLRRRKLMKYYNQVRYIANLLGSKVKYPTLTSTEYYLLLRGFMKRSEAFRRYLGQCPKRKNFLSYNLILRLLCEEYGICRLLPFIPNLKSQKTLDRQLVVWNELDAYL
jgi:hypothetical protein